MLYKKVLSRKTVGFALFFLLNGALLAPAFAQIQALNPRELLQAKLNPKPNARAPKTPWLKDHQELSKAKKILFSKNPSLAEVIQSQHQLLMVRSDSPHGGLEKEMDETISALEFRRAELLVKSKQEEAALISFHRATRGLSQTKWTFYWRESTSKALASICYKKIKNKAEKNEACLVIAKKVAEVFPKNALETVPLWSLPSLEFTPLADVYPDRISTSYSEKIEKDEKDFAPLLEAFLAREHSDLKRLVDDFLKDYPKSNLRFRALFLLAESYTRKENPEDALPHYKKIIEQTPLSFYALVASERIGMKAKDLVKKAPTKVDPAAFNLNYIDQITLSRLEALLKSKKNNFLNLELEAMSRTRNYSSDLLLYLLAIAEKGNQQLAGFRIVNELIQRQYAGLLNEDFLPYVFPIVFEKEIEIEAQTNKVDPLWILSLMKQESGFKADITSSSGAMGLMQLMPFTALDVQKDIWMEQVREPSRNISLGTRYLAKLIQKFEGNIPFALAGYNAGPHRVVKWKKELMKPEDGMIEFIESIPFKETRDYVMAIIRNRYWYQVRKGLQVESVFKYWGSNTAISSVSGPVATPSETPTPAASAPASSKN